MKVSVTRRNSNELSRGDGLFSPPSIRVFCILLKILVRAVSAQCLEQLRNDGAGIWGSSPHSPLSQPAWCCRGCLIFQHFCFSCCKIHRRKLPFPLRGFGKWGWQVLYWRQVGLEQMDEKCLSPCGALRGPLAEQSCHPGAPCFHLKQHLEFHQRFILPQIFCICSVRAQLSVFAAREELCTLLEPSLIIHLFSVINSSKWGFFVSLSLLWYFCAVEKLICIK